MVVWKSLSGQNEDVMKTLYRNKKILELANETEHCLGCGRYNDGCVVGAHSNQLRDGKGRGIKAHDYRIAYMCDRCHYEIDQGTTLSRDERKERWEDAHRATIGWLFENGHLTVK